MESSESEQLMKVLTAAHEHALHREYQAAAQSLSKAAALLPMDTDVHLCLAGMLWEAGKNLEAEQASSLAVATSADTAKTGLGLALRANIRWCQGNLLGAYEDLQTAQQAMQASESRYATNMSEDLEWLATQISACSEDREGRYHTQEDAGVATLEAVGKVAMAKPQEVAQLHMQVPKADTQSDQGCKIGYEDASNQLGDDELALTDPSKAHMQPEQPPETGSLQSVFLALDSIVRGRGCAAHTSSVAPRGPPNSDADGPVDPDKRSLESSSTSSLGYTTDASSRVSPTPANVSCCSGSGGPAKSVASTSQYDLDQALGALQPNKEQGGARSDAESDKAASEVLKEVQVGGSSLCEDMPQDCSPRHVTESHLPDDANFGGALHGIKAFVKGYKAAAGPCLSRNTAIGVSLAIGCAAAVVFCQMNAKHRSQH